MEKIKFDLSKSFGKFKMMNATNGGPLHKRHKNDQFRSNLEEYKEARIPYARNHDANACMIYGGPFAHDISAIFPNFDADETKPESYDFACTDECIAMTLDAGTKTFFRLGETIEHQIKKHHTLPPKDFKKWARICEHIIRHYTEGWADGFKYDMPYWEIWNEPDLGEGSGEQPCWGGTRYEFFDLYEITAKHLKACFPHLKIGGPALAHNLSWADEFLGEMKKRGVEIDFFSHHAYSQGPMDTANRTVRIRALLDKHGYTKTESILNEINYIKNWEDKFVYSIQQITGLKGASFTLSHFCACQKAPLDMFMYYDMRPSAFNGVFDYYTLKPLKGYYPFKWYGGFYDLENEIRSEDNIPEIYTLAGVDKDGKVTAMLTYYADLDQAENKVFKLDFGKENSEYEIYLLDETHNSELVKTTKDLTFDIPLFTSILIKEK